MTGEVLQAGITETVCKLEDKEKDMFKKKQKNNPKLNVAVLKSGMHASHT